MTAQEIFNIVAKHLRQQGRPSLGFGGRCRYRGANGTMCAVGVLIPDEMYDEYEMESRSVRGIVGLTNVPRYFVYHTDLLASLQYCHDNCDRTQDGMFDINDLNARLAEIAKKHEVNYSEASL